MRIYGWNLKFDLHVLKRINIDVKTRDVFDGMLASWLCDENSPNGLKDNTTTKERKEYSIPSVQQSVADPVTKYMTPQQLDKAIANTKRLMQAAAAKMDFLEAAQYRDEMFKLETLKAELVK